MEELQERCILFGWAVKRLLRQKANWGILEGFLTVLLDEKITIVEILECESNQQTIVGKFSRMEIKALNSSTEIVIIEIRIIRELDCLEYLLYGTTKNTPKPISSDEHYKKAKKGYSINILDFDFGKGTDYLYRGQDHFTAVHTGDHLQISAKKKEVIISCIPVGISPEYFLIKVNEFDKVAVTPLEEWMKYLKDGTIRPETTAPGLGEAKEKLKYYSMPPQERMAYNEYLNILMIQNDVLDSAKLEGKIEQEKEGENEAKRTVARNLKSMNLSIEQITQATGLAPEEIEKL